MATEEREHEFQRRLGMLMAGLRESKGLSQEALAVQLSRDQSYVSRIESSDRQVSILGLIEWLDALGVDFLEVAERVRSAWQQSERRDD
jgi:transcriptional regulator with XRE-family HTH domain